MEHEKLKLLREGAPLGLSDLLILTFQLSIPAILAQVSTVVMEFIDASMLGHLGSGEAAAIGLVSSSTWLMGGMCSALFTGFNVQIAHAVGAQRKDRARAIVRQGLTLTLLFTLVLAVIAAVISPALPRWLGGGEEVAANASRYFLIYTLFFPASMLGWQASGMLQCSGNMRLPGVVQSVMCALDVVFNALLIFPTRSVTVLGLSFTMPGAGLGVTGAALGTGLSELAGGGFLLWYLLFRSPELRLNRGERLKWNPDTLKTVLRIGLPVGFEQVVMSAAQVLSTRIVSPLGVTAIAAHTFSISVGSLCYMPGYGIGSAATTLIGQSIGAKRQDVTRTLAWLTTLTGMAVMTGTGVLMFCLAPQMIGLMSPDGEIQALGAAVLRIEAFAEPLYAASIVASGVLRGAGDTLVPSAMNFASIWLVRLPLAAFLAPGMGLRGVWLAMCIELFLRGGLMLVRMGRKRWEDVHDTIR
jgi:putative MATE family efflux protein